MDAIASMDDRNLFGYPDVTGIGRIPLQLSVSLLLCCSTSFSRPHVRESESKCSLFYGGMAGAVAPLSKLSEFQARTHSLFFYSLKHKNITAATKTTVYH